MVDQHNENSKSRDDDEIDPRPHWIPLLVIIGIAVPLLALMVLGSILFG